MNPSKLMRKRTLRGVMLAAAIAAAAGSSGGGCIPTGTENEGGALAFKNVSAPTMAVPNETVTVRWGYANASTLASQELRMHFVSLHRGLESCTKTLPVSRREFQFQFAGPIRIELLATDTSGHDTNFSLEIIDQQSGLINLKSLQFTAGTYPYLGQPRSAESGQIIPALFSLTFSRTFAVFDADSDGTIDDLTRPPFRDVFLGGHEFLGQLNSPRECELFQFAFGSDFPMLPAGIGPLNRRRADAVVFGVGLACDGIEVTDPKTRRVYRQNTRNLLPCFISIDLYKSGATWRVADMHLGDIRPHLPPCRSRYVPWGFVVSAARLAPPLGQTTVGVNGSLPVDMASGHCTGSKNNMKLGAGLTLADGTAVFDQSSGIPIAGAFVTISELMWDVPIIADNDGSITTLFAGYTCQ